MTSDFLQGSLVLSVPLILAALGELVTERSGVINTGIEGLMLIGAFAAFAATYATGSPVLGLAAGAVSATAAGALFAVLTVAFKADQVITGTGLNLLGPGLTGTLYRAMFPPSSRALFVEPLAGKRTPVLSELPLLGPLVFRQNALVPLSLLLAPLLWWLLYRTRAGLVLRATGEKPEAPDAAGYHVGLVRFLAVLAGAGLAGLGGGYLSVVAGNTFVEGMTNGRGFIALSLVIFGRWNPWGIVASAVFFGMAWQAQYSLPGLGWRLSPQAVAMVPYLATLLALALMRRGRTTGPAALAQPYHR